MTDEEKYERGLRFKALLMKVERAALEDQDLDIGGNEPESHKEPQIVRMKSGYIWR